jgi:hypothetical protein
MKNNKCFLIYFSLIITTYYMTFILLPHPGTTGSDTFQSGSLNIIVPWFHGAFLLYVYSYTSAYF